MEPDIITETVRAAVTSVTTPIEDRIKTLEENLRVMEESKIQPDDGLSAGRRASVEAAAKTGKIIEAGGLAVRGMTAALVATEDREVIEAMGGLMRSLVYARNNNVSLASAADWVENHHGQRSAAAFVREYDTRSGNTRTLNTTTTSAGGALIQFDLLLDQFETLLYAARPLVALGVRRVGFNNGKARIPRLLSGSQPSFNAEGKPIPATEPKFGYLDLTAKDLDALVSMSNDLLYDTSYGATQYVVADLVEQLAIKLDTSCLFGDGTNGSILGAYYTPGVNLTTANTGSKSMQKDATAMRGSYYAANPRNRKPGWLMHPQIMVAIQDTTSTTGNLIFDEQIGRGVWRGMPFQTSTIVPYSTGSAGTILALADWSQMTVGVAKEVTIETSTEGTIVNPDGSVTSAFQSKLSLLRATQRNDAVLTQPGVFNFLQAVPTNGTWTWL
jgi:HK97 family phage major capsid protein